MPRIMLLQIFAACPAPAGPQSTAREPITSSSGRIASKASAGPPAMKVSVPAAAPTVPPETGASIAARPAAAASAATARALSTSTVEQSTRTVPAPAAGTISA